MLGGVSHPSLRSDIVEGGRVLTLTVSLVLVVSHVSIALENPLDVFQGLRVKSTGDPWERSGDLTDAQEGVWRPLVSLNHVLRTTALVCSSVIFQRRQGVPMGLCDSQPVAQAEAHTCESLVKLLSPARCLTSLYFSTNQTPGIPLFTEQQCWK